MLGLNELLVVALVAIILFGAPKVIEWAKALGKAKREYELASKGEDKKE